MRLLLCLLAFLPFLEAFVLPQITFNSNVQVDDVLAESQSRSPQHIVLDALDYKSSATGCKKVCAMADHINNKRKHMRRIWEMAQVDGWLNIWLKAVPYNDWPYRVAKYIWDKPSPDIDCGSMEADNCHPLNNNCCKPPDHVAIDHYSSYTNKTQTPYARTAESKRRDTSFTGRQRDFILPPRHCTNSFRISPFKMPLVWAGSYLTGTVPATQTLRPMLRPF